MTREGRTEKPEASSSSSSLRRDQVGEVELGAGGGGAGGAVVISVPEVGVRVAAGAVVASEQEDRCRRQVQKRSAPYSLEGSGPPVPNPLPSVS
jgi:hypothetical protein